MLYRNIHIIHSWQVTKTYKKVHFVSYHTQIFRILRNTYKPAAVKTKWKIFVCLSLLTYVRRIVVWRVYFQLIILSNFSASSFDFLRYFSSVRVRVFLYLYFSNTHVSMYFICIYFIEFSSQNFPSRLLYGRHQFSDFSGRIDCLVVAREKSNSQRVNSFCAIRLSIKLYALIISYCIRNFPSARYYRGLAHKGDNILVKLHHFYL